MMEENGMQKNDMAPGAGIDYLSSRTDHRVCQARSDSSRQRLLLVDDDPVYVEVLSGNLEDTGFDVIAYTDSAAAMSWLLRGGMCDAILLDWYMPDVPGKVFLKRVRDAGMTYPVMVLSGSDDDIVEDVALGSGAIDFVDKARRFSVLRKRLEIIMDGPKYDDDSPARESFSVGPLRLDPKSCRAHWHGTEAGLTITEFRIVNKLAAQPGVDFTYREIYDVVHGEGFHAGDGVEGIRVNVRSLIKRIRRKFRDIDDTFEAIENYPGYGYRWRAEAREPVRPQKVLDERSAAAEPALSVAAYNAA